MRCSSSYLPTIYAILVGSKGFFLLNIILYTIQINMRRLLFTLPLILLAACNADKSDYDASGVFEATEVILSAQTQGEMIQMNYEEGDTVSKGCALAVVDTMQLSLQRRQLVAGLTALGSQHYNVARQVADLKQQLATQRRERERFARLVSENAGNRKQVDDIDAQISLLERQIAARTETLDNTNRSLTNEAQGVEAQIAQLDDQLRRAHVVSPISGTVLSKYAEAGELATPGTKLYKLADLSHVYLRAYVTAPQLTKIKIGQKVRIYADQGKQDRKAYEGRVSWIAQEAEFTPKTIQTRDERANLVYAVKIAVPNDGLIKLGMYGECKFL